MDNSLTTQICPVHKKHEAEVYMEHLSVMHQLIGSDVIEEGRTKSGNFDRHILDTWRNYLGPVKG